LAETRQETRAACERSGNSFRIVGMGGNARKMSRRRRAAAILWAAAALAIVCGCWRALPMRASDGQKVTYPKEIARVTFAAAGDVIPHQAVKEAAAAAASAEKAGEKEAAKAEASSTSAPATPSSGAAGKGQSTATEQAASQPATSEQTSSQQASHTGDDAGWDEEFADVADVFRSVDFGFVNLETPVAPKHSVGTKAFQFGAPVALLEALKYSGVKIVSFANNHVFDQGYAGFDETLEHLREQGILFAGSGDTAEDAWKPVIVEKNGIKVGWLGMTRWLNGHRNPEKDSAPHVAFFPYPGESNGAPGRDEAGVLDAIQAARAECDFLIISIHWGIEYAPAPRPEDEEMAHKMLEAGAGMVIGHHPHVLQPMETYLTQDGRHCVIIFSLGNFLSNQSRDYVNGLAPDKDGDPRDEMMVKFSVVKKDYGPGGARVELADVGAIPVWEENNNLRYRSGKDRQPVIRPEFIDRMIPVMQAHLEELGKLTTPLTAEQKQEFVQVTKELELLKHRREIILARVGDDFIVAPPGN
jgi:poly-gamma-glutamate capsule biosynthesis protein CapA/YwtB (metallophosphatase superfamily)